MRNLRDALKVDGWMTFNELSWLRATALSLPPGAKIFEVGSWKGRSAVALAVDQAILTCVDTFRGGAQDVTRGLADRQNIFGMFTANMKRLKLRPNIWKMTSLEAVALLPSESVDMVFDDSDHNDKFETHFWAWYRKIKPGGIYCGHDYQALFPEIPRVLIASGLKFSVIPGTMIWALRKQ